MIAPEQVTVTDSLITVKFPYPPPAEKDELKMNFGARWNPAKKVWELRPSNKLFAYLADQGALAAGDVPDPVSLLSDGPQPENFKINLFPYQRAGVQFLRELKNGILGDEMGLGKTLESIAVVKDSLPCLIVSPVIAKSVWQREIEKALTGASVKVVTSKTLSRADYSADFIIVNYDILVKVQQHLESIPFQSLVCDEAHYLKNLKAKRTRALMQIGENIPHKLMVTGTPVLNRPIELYSLLVILGLDREVAPSYWNYVRDYCGGYVNRFSGNWETKGASNLGELHRAVAPYILRRLKKDVLKDLPEKTISKLEWDLDRQDLKEYEYCRDDFVGYYLSKNPELTRTEIERKPLGLMQLGSMRQLSSLAKQRIITEFLVESFEPEGKKAVIFGEYRDLVGGLHQSFRENSVIIWGGQTDKERAEAERRFQEDPDCLFCFASTKAAGVALTLTAADTAIFLTIPWTPGDFAQASDRIHRIGQKNAVNIVVPVSTEIDGELFKLIVSKERIVGSIVDGSADDGQIGGSETQIMSQLAEKLGLNLRKGDLFEDVHDDDDVVQR